MILKSTLINSACSQKTDHEILRLKTSKPNRGMRIRHELYPWQHKYNEINNKYQQWHKLSARGSACEHNYIEKNTCQYLLKLIARQYSGRKKKETKQMKIVKKIKEAEAV